VKLLVTGAAGMLGHRVVALAREAGHDVVAADLAEFDLTDRMEVEDFLGHVRPGAVVNCAAYTDVDRAETDEALALAVNGDGAGNLARAAAHHGAKVVHVSTDYVFDGTDIGRPWVESDAVAPLGAYGRTKLAGEQQVAAATDRHAIVRTAWLFGAGGPNFPDTMLRLAAERDELSVVTDQVGCPTWTGHLAPLLVELASDDRTGVLHGAGGGRCSWHELCVEVLRRAGVETLVRETTSADFVRPAPRPAWSVMATERPDGLHLPPWQEGVAGHLEETT
jgi:dTDP-4-dehydrorhamnose reductase